MTHTTSRLVGKHGGLAHRAMLDAVVRSIVDLQMRGVKISGSTDEYIMMMHLGQTSRGTRGRKKGAKIPDALILLEDGFLIVEIGDYQPDKWPGVPVLHVGKRGHVAIINPSDSLIESVVLAAVCTRLIIDARGGGGT